MRIAQVAPLIESVPPRHYGGTGRIVSYLTEELVRAGHDVTLFGSGDSVTSARLYCADPDPHVEWVGEISDQQKNEFLGNAYALLFPIDWPESFGLVMIEAMACGTPVIAYESGSVPEVMEDGITGFVVSELDEAAEAIGRVAKLSRARCREVFEKRFTATRMADDYIEVYEQMVRRTAVDYAEVAAS